MKSKKIIIFVIAGLLLIAGYLYFNSQKDVIEPQKPLLPRYVAAEGIVETLPGRQIEVGTDLLSARIASMRVKEGDYVKKGEILATLLATDIDAKVAESESELGASRARLAEVVTGSRPQELRRAEAALDAAAAAAALAKAEYERSVHLQKQGLISDASFDEKSAALKAAQASRQEAYEEVSLLKAGPKKETIRFYEESVGRAEAALAYYKSLLDKTVIRSPIDGKVIRKDLEEGESVVPETPILVVADLTVLRINAEVDETDAGRINLGDRVEVTSDAYPGKVYNGSIDEIADYVGGRLVKPNNTAKNLDMKVIQVKVRLVDKTPLKIGMTVDVRIIPSSGKVEGL